MAALFYAYKRLCIYLINLAVAIGSLTTQTADQSTSNTRDKSRIFIRLCIVCVEEKELEESISIQVKVQPMFSNLTG